MNRSLFILVLCFAGCGESKLLTFDATVDHADASDAASEVFSDADTSVDTSVDAPVDAPVEAPRDASMDALTDASIMDARADSHD